LLQLAQLFGQCHLGQQSVDTSLDVVRALRGTRCRKQERKNNDETE